MYLHNQHELFNNISFDSSSHDKCNTLTEKSIFFDNLNFGISPKKAENKKINAAKKNTTINSIKRNNKNKKKENNNDFRSICRKLDFSDNSDYNNSNSNFSISDNENIEITEDYSEITNENKNSDFSLSILNEEKNKKKGKTKSKKKYNSEKELTFINKKQSSEENSFDLEFSKFDKEYIIVKTLCDGEMGTVYLCFRIKDKKKYVVKITNHFSRKLDYDNMNIFVNDINIHSKDQEFYFIHKYIDFWIEESYEKNNKSISNSKNMYIVTDYCFNGNLKQYLSSIKTSNNYKLNYSFYWDIIFQMIIPINFLHKLGYIHFDIKPTNYLVNENNQLLLNDFCLSLKEDNVNNFETDILEGDSIYISPELFYKDLGIITHKIDIFSLGLSILELLTDIELPKNGPIWQDMRNHEIPKEFLDKIPLINDDYENRYKLIELIAEMTQINSLLRPELDTLLNNENKYPELYNRYKMLKNKEYNSNILVNIENKDTSIINEEVCKNREKEKEESDYANGINVNLNRLFLKRSNSMEFVVGDSSSNSNFYYH